MTLNVPEVSFIAHKTLHCFHTGAEHFSPHRMVAAQSMNRVQQPLVPKITSAQPSGQQANSSLCHPIKGTNESLGYWRVHSKEEVK